MGKVISTKGHIVFDSSVEDEFVETVINSLEDSGLETEWYSMENQPDDVLLIKDVKSFGDIARQVST